jgi:hypothetical protein
MATNERLAKALSCVATWMIEHGAPLLAENLADGATADQLIEAEADFGFAFPSELRDLWTLHNGQKEEMNGFIEYLDLLDARRAFGERDSVDLALHLLRESPQRSPKAPNGEEIASDHWVPFAGRDSDLLVVSAVSGRVFSCSDGEMVLVAPSITDWAEHYAARVLADDFAVEEGFGDYHLAKRDREAETREQNLTREREHYARYRREKPLATQLRDALSAKDVDRCLDVFELAVNSPGQLGEIVDLLFDQASDPKMIAAALRIQLQRLTLTPERWAIVSKGGALLENNAIRDFAAARAPKTKRRWWQWGP